MGDLYEGGERVRCELIVHGVLEWTWCIQTHGNILPPLRQTQAPEVGGGSHLHQICGLRAQVYGLHCREISYIETREISYIETRETQ